MPIAYVKGASLTDVFPTTKTLFAVRLATQANLYEFVDPLPQLSHSENSPDIENDKGYISTAILIGGIQSLWANYILVIPELR